MELRLLEVSRIVEDPEQPRKALDETTLASLADSIKQHGILNPITVAPLKGVDGFRIVTGERRWRAAQIAGLYEMPCIVRGEDEQQGDESDALAGKTTEQLIENLQREELSPVDKANAIKALKDNLGATNREVGSRLGLSERTVGYLLDLLDLPDAIGDQIVSSPNRPADGNLTEKHGRFLRQLNDQPDLQAHLVEKIKGEKLSSEDTAKLTRALRANPDKQGEIMESSVGDLPRVLNKSGDEAAALFSAGRAFGQMLDKMVSTVGEIKLTSVSHGDLAQVEEAALRARAALDGLIIEVRAAQKSE